MKEEDKDLNYWKENAEECYMTTPIGVLRYITELEKVAENYTALPLVSNSVCGYHSNYECEFRQKDNRCTSNDDCSMKTN